MMYRVFMVLQHPSASLFLCVQHLVQKCDDITSLCMEVFRMFLLPGHLVFL
jgi:hypothetical protein